MTLRLSHATKKKLPLAFSVLMVTSMLNTPALANDTADALSNAFKNGKVNLDMRYRYEFVDQDTLREAKASSLRTRLGFQTGEVHGFYANIEGENVSYIGADRFNNTVNSKTSFATVEDPDTTEINQAYLGINAIPNTQIKLGRQLLRMGSGNFIGSQDWRQNQTSYDAAYVLNDSLPDVKIAYSFIAKQHNRFGDDSIVGNVNLNTHAVDVTYEGLPWTNVTPYAYFIKDEEDASKSNQMFGVFLDGKNQISDTVTLGHHVEYAFQRDYGNNVNNVNLNYFHVEPSISWKNVTLSAGYESLEGDGTTGFITVLGDNHNFNGWVDKFDTVPADGLEDTFVTVTYKVKGVHEYLDGTKLFTGYHQFDSQNTNAELGEEWDMGMVNPRFVLQF